MEVRAVLREARRSKGRLGALLERRERYARLEACHSAGRAEALEALQREVDRQIEDLARTELEAERRIEALEDPCQREVLRYRYLDGREWREIARRMNYSQDWVKHMHTRALREMEGE